jgi:hypothetical protein
MAHAVYVMDAVQLLKNFIQFFVSANDADDLYELHELSKTTSRHILAIMRSIFL